MTAIDREIAIDAVLAGYCGTGRDSTIAHLVSLGVARVEAAVLLNEIDDDLCGAEGLAVLGQDD